MRPLSAFFALSLLAACQAPSVPGAVEPGGTVLVTINGRPITQEMVDAQVAQLPTEMRVQMERSGRISQLADNLVTQEILYQEALKRKVEQRPEVKLQLALAARNALAQVVLAEELDRRLSEQALQAWYQDHLVQFARPQVSASIMQLPTEEKARELAAQIQAGGDFAALARQHSTDGRTAPDGGRLGWLSQREVREPLASALFSTPKGQISGPLQMGEAWYLVRVDDTRTQAPFEEVRETVRAQAEREVRDKVIQELTAAATVERRTPSTPPAEGLPAVHPPVPTAGAATPGGGGAEAGTAAPPPPAGQGG